MPDIQEGKDRSADFRFYTPKIAAFQVQRQTETEPLDVPSQSPNGSAGLPLEIQDQRNLVLTAVSTNDWSFICLGIHISQSMGIAQFGSKEEVGK